MIGRGEEVGEIAKRGGRVLGGVDALSPLKQGRGVDAAKGKPTINIAEGDG